MLTINPSVTCNECNAPMHIEECSVHDHNLIILCLCAGMPVHRYISVQSVWNAVYNNIRIEQQDIHLTFTLMQQGGKP